MYYIFGEREALKGFHVWCGIKRNAEEMETYDQGPTTASQKDVDCLGSWLHIINLLILSIIYFTSVGRSDSFFNIIFFILTIDCLGYKQDIGNLIFIDFMY